jgi:hypothetical protein
MKKQGRKGDLCYAMHKFSNLLRHDSVTICSFLLNRVRLTTDTKIRVYRTIILPAVFYGCETWSLTLREEQRLRVFENTVLRRIFGPKRDEATGEWRRLHNEQLDDLYSSPNIIRVMKSRRMR